MVVEMDQPLPKESLEWLEHREGIVKVTYINVTEGEEDDVYNSLEEIVRECQEKDLPFDEVILLDDMNERNVSREESIETMRGMWEAMKGAERNYDGSLQSRSGLVGGAGRRCVRMSRAEHALRTVCRKSYGICT